MGDFWIKLVEQEIGNDPSLLKFWNGIEVWIERPHLINRKLMGKETAYRFSIPDSKSDENFKHIFHDVFASPALSQYLKINDSIEELNEYADNKLDLVFRKIIPRNPDRFPEVMEAVIKDKKNNAVTFWPKESDVCLSAITPVFPYRIRQDNTRILIEIYEKDLEPNAAEASKEWLKSSVFPKIIKWCYNENTNSVLTSLTLVSERKYSYTYSYLKMKYGKKFVMSWPEVSDPAKCVYEDIAIAAYLIVLWEMDREKLDVSSKQTFVDVGCGNGLLVHILVSEGYQGIGIDVRKRKIWDLYGEGTTLIEEAILPSDYSIFSSYDWIIGNHCDELTPWIPFIAARCNYKMKVFLLPCCAYTFSGKYERREGKSQYQSYLSFIQSVCKTMGFNVLQDKLRIPSTKRICFICNSRSYNEEDEKNVDLERMDFIKRCSGITEKIPSCIFNSKSVNGNRAKQTANVSNKSTILKETTNLVANFKPRDKVQLIQNCSQLDRKFLKNTVITVMNLLLKTDNILCLQRGEDTIQWNTGGKIKLRNLIELLDPAILKSMKNQSGGLQTFIRNHRNVFQFDGGCIQLNVPQKGLPLNSKSVTKQKRVKSEYPFKQKPCIFYFYHPHGCPLLESDCNFNHNCNEF